MKLTLLAIASLLLAVVLTPPAPLAPSFTAAQAVSGQFLYYENCAECHGASLEGNFGPGLDAPNGNVQWNSISFVWNYMIQHMPEGNAGGLRTDQYLAIMSFLMKSNGDPPGPTPLRADAANESKAFLAPPK